MANETLKKGSSGESVKELQSMLVDLGYDLGTYGENKNGVDGVFGAKTEAALKDYQAKQASSGNTGLGTGTGALKDADGIYGAKTQAALSSSWDDWKASQNATGGAYVGDVVSKDQQPTTKTEEKPATQQTQQQPTTNTTNYTEQISVEPLYPAQSLEEYKAELDADSAEITKYLLEMNAANVDMSVKEIESNLESSLNELTQPKAEAYLNKLKEESNIALRNAAAGDNGGIGNAMYSASDATYDAALYEIDLQAIALQNAAEQQIAQLKAEGRFEDAQMLSEWEQKKLDMYDAYKQFLFSLSADQQQVAYNQAATEREYAYNSTMDMLSKGLNVDADTLTNLGIDPAEAESYANYINLLAKYDVELAQAQLDELTKKAVTTETSEPKTITVYDAEGNAREIEINSDGTIDGLREGDYMLDDNGGKVYYNGKDGFITQASIDRDAWFDKVNDMLGTEDYNGIYVTDRTQLLNQLIANKKRFKETVNELKAELDNTPMEMQFDGTYTSSNYRIKLQQQLNYYQGLLDETTELINSAPTA